MVGVYFVGLRVGEAYSSVRSHSGVVSSQTGAKTPNFGDNRC
jgi:hypothetical protein